MKRKLLLTLMCLTSANMAFGTDLMQAFQQALVSDPIYQQAVAQQLSDSEFVPIARSQLFPQATFLGGPTLTKEHISGHPEFTFTDRGYSFTLGITQTVFNMAQFAALANAKAVSKAANASLNASMQSLMLRVSQAYFSVLKDEDFVSFNRANREAYAKQYDQIRQQYKVGLKTVTDLYTAKASYDTASAQFISAQTTLANDRENLRAITGMYYPSIATLSEKFPLISPKPTDREAWVHTAELQNWSIQAALYNAQAARETIKQQFAGHLPTVSLQGTYSAGYNASITSTSLSNTSVSTVPGSGTSASTTTTSQLAGAGFALPTHTQDAGVSLNLGVPIFQGGLVVAQTNQAKDNYKIATERLEETIRQTANQTRQSYMNVMAGIQQIRADQQAIKSTRSSYEGLMEGYHVGTETLVDVLNQQQKVFQAETQYANDRYSYVYNLLVLKYEVGTLSDEDLKAVNAWLIDNNIEPYDSALLEDHRYQYHGHPQYYHVVKNHVPLHPRVAAVAPDQEFASAKKLLALASNKNFNTHIRGADVSLTP